MSIAFFDFDGTLIKGDSFLLFLQFSKGKAKYWFGMLINLPVLLAFKLGIIPNWKAKEIVFSYFFKGEKNQNLIKMGELFAQQQIPNLLLPIAQKELELHQKINTKIVIVSASFSVWLQPWCDKNQFDLIASKHEINDNIVTGKLLGRNCHGIEKAKQIQQTYELEKYDSVYAYGDSRSDIPMLKLANHQWMKWKQL